MCAVLILMCIIPESSKNPSPASTIWVDSPGLHVAQEDSRESSEDSYLLASDLRTCGQPVQAQSIDGVRDSFEVASSILPEKSLWRRPWATVRRSTRGRQETRADF